LLTFIISISFYFTYKIENLELNYFQGGGEAPKNVSGRLLAATWWLFGFIIIASYTANLAAFLTVSRLETPITSLDDLSKQYKIKYSPMNNSDAMIYFQRRAYIEEKFYQ
jgi:ionotropic glutamate receptor